MPQPAPTSAATAASGVGSYAINGSGLSAANYVFAQGTGNATALTITPATNRSGTATVTLTLTDGDNTTATDTFDVVVAAVNDAPTVSDISDHSTAEDTPGQSIDFTVIVDILVADFPNQRDHAIQILVVKFVRCDRSRYPGATLSTPGWRLAWCLGVSLVFQIFPGGTKTSRRTFATSRVKVKDRTSRLPRCIATPFRFHYVNTVDVSTRYHVSSYHFTLAVVLRVA